MINDRIKELVDKYFDGNISAFSRAVNVKQPTMNTILGERKSKPSFDVIENIINADTLQINAEWLITGKGKMKKSPEYSTETNYDNSLQEQIIDYKNSGKNVFYSISDLTKTINNISEAGIINAKTNETNSKNMERLITLLEKKDEQLNIKESNLKGDDQVQKFGNDDVARDA